MRGFKVLAVASAAFIQSLSMPAQAVDFLSAIEDIPLPNALEEATTPVVFETQWGRVIQSRAVGDMEAADALDFYDGVLPQLGWTRIDDAGAFRRGDELLKLEAQATEDGLELTFRLVVQPASSRMDRH